MQFWELDSPETTRGLAEIDHEAYRRLKEQYGDMSPQLRAERVPGVPQPVMLGGSTVKDFTWTWQHQCLIQGRVLHMFREQGFTGFDVHPVKARWKRHDGSAAEIPTLWELIPMGWGGVAPEESGMRLLHVRPTDQRRTYSKYVDPSRLIDESQWDESDFFIIWPLPVHIYVSDRVARFIRSEKLTGVRLVRIDDLVWPGGIGDTCSPVGLRYFLPEARAREIGEPLGIY